MRLQLIASLAISMAVATTAMAFDKPEFPRLAGINIGGNHNYQDAAYQQKLAKLNISLLNVWPGWEQSSGMSIDTVAKNIKAINPKSLVFLYTNNNELNMSGGSAVQETLNKLNSMGWWLYPSGTGGSAVKSTYGTDTYIINNSLYTPKDSSGQNFVDWYSSYAVRIYGTPNPNVDGFFLDNVFWKPRVDGDWNRDGTVDGKDTAAAATMLRAGARRHFDNLKTLMPGKYQLGNIADWGASDAVFPELSGVLNGGVMEGLIGYSYSPEGWGSWSEMMRQYRKMIGALAEPKLAFFGQIGSTTDYQGMRYGLASCLMDDAYFSYTDSAAEYASVPWFDEFDVKLGQATGKPATAAWQKGVWRRDFANGIALVNPKGNGTVTVTLEEDFRRISGKQDATTNNGQTTRSVTLKDRDGIILLRTKALAVPTAPGSVTVK